jgi:hypothetical protein
MNLAFGVLREGVPADEKVVRNTATPVDDNTPAAMQTDMPEMGEVETDHNPNLGMVNRQLASKWIPSVKFSPFWKPNVDDQAQHNLIIDRQVSSSGTAAAREAAGEFGRGTAAYAIGIEPVGDLQQGHKMGNEYFKANDPGIQSTMGDAMSTPPGTDQSTKGAVAGMGKVYARIAATAGLYDTMWNEGK